MKKLIIVLLTVFLFTSISFAHLTGKEGHEKTLYPIVRVSVTQSGSGSGTIVYSKFSDDKKFSTYVLTNHHVIAEAISISNEWDSALAKDVKTERRSTCYVEIFKYRNLSTPVGTMKLEADIVVYNENEDMALLLLRYDDAIYYTATMPEADKTKEYRVLDESIAVGCSLGWPTLPSKGIITRLGYLIDSLPFDMSSAQTIFGNSGGAIFTSDGVFIGIPSRVAIQGWSTAVAHMGAFIPVYRIYEWFDKEHYEFLYDPDKTEAACMEEREKEIEAKKKADK